MFTIDSGVINPALAAWFRLVNRSFQPVVTGGSGTITISSLTEGNGQLSGTGTGFSVTFEADGYIHP
jgi:hypothetical protein